MNLSLEQYCQERCNDSILAKNNISPIITFSSAPLFWSIAVIEYSTGFIRPRRATEGGARRAQCELDAGARTALTIDRPTERHDRHACLTRCFSSRASEPADGACSPISCPLMCSLNGQTPTYTLAGRRQRRNNERSGN